MKKDTKTVRVINSFERIGFTNPIGLQQRSLGLRCINDLLYLETEETVYVLSRKELIKALQETENESDPDVSAAWLF